ncbi:RraA family protein [Clostridium sp. AM58-1XD]|uniref:RraA family protein n=1 Tax=Clostridium sp. AM58-1XD TaxID=2292307 RepID=UPI000E4A7CA9|nr:RraA family protein [Clostridium sp. AM58-1XD]RGZ00600.1 RraA family protein [Clostridium sp. AM58-1XD]
MMDEYVKQLSRLETGVITDSMRLLGIDGWMESMHPVNQESRICGRAFTMAYTLETDAGEAQSYSYYQLLDEITPGDVIVLAANNCPYAIFGENMQHASRQMGSAGIILDGKNRDTTVIRNYGQPVFSRGQEIRFMPGNFKITAYQTQVNCAGVVVRPGDYITGDADGVIVIPKGRIRDVLYQAERIAVLELSMEEAINSGKTMKECAGIVAQKGDKRI